MTDNERKYKLEKKNKYVNYRFNTKGISVFCSVVFLLAVRLFGPKFGDFIANNASLWDGFLLPTIPVSIALVICNACKARNLDTKITKDESKETEGVKTKVKK